MFFNCINCKLKKKFRGRCDLRSLSPNPETGLVEPKRFTMLREFVCRVLVMILGYAYPTFQCFKILEHSRVNINDLRFCCQYWVIIAILSVCERIGVVFISGLPLYDELKLLFIIYLWSPRTNGTSYVYETLLQPLVSRHETDIDQHLSDLRLRAWDLAIYYWQNCTELGQGAFVQVIQFLLTQSQRLRSGNIGTPQVFSPIPVSHNSHSTVSLDSFNRCFSYLGSLCQFLGPKCWGFTPTKINLDFSFAIFIQFVSEYWASDEELCEGWLLAFSSTAWN